MKHCIMLITAMAVFTCTAIAQHISDFDMRHFNTQNGLPQSSIRAIAQDEYGFIWMASEAGLLRYDGRSFKIYNKKNAGISTSRILSIARPPEKKELLAISDYGEILHIEKGKASPYHHSLSAVFLQQQEYIGHSDDSLMNIAFRNYYYMDRQLLFAGNKLSAFLLLNDGIRWYKDTTLIARTPLKPLKDFSTVFVLGKAIFLSYNKLSAGTMIRVEPDKVSQVRITGDFMKQAPNNRPRETFFTTNYATGTVFLFSGSNLYSVRLLPDGNLNTKLLLSGFGLLEHQINSVYYDSAGGRILLGSGTEGLFVFTRKRFFTSLYPDNDPFANVHYSLVPLSDTSLLSGSGMVLFTRKGSKPEFRELLRKPGNYGYELFRSAQRGIWFCTSPYLFQLDSTAHRIIRKFKMIGAISEQQNHDIWVTALGSGIYKINASNHSFRVLAGIKAAQCMVWETDTVCWIGTENHLFRYHASSGKVDTFQALNNKVVRSIYIPRPGEVWICSYESGLYLWKDGKLTSFTTKEYPALQTVHKVLEDNYGFFWISTNDGLYQVARADLLHHSRDTTFQPYFFRYSVEDGFLTNEFNGSGQRAGTKLPNGFFAFPSMKGVVFFKPEITLPELPGKPIIIDKITVDGREKNPEQRPITIERGFEQITITPATAYLGNAANLKYEFNLNGSDKWQALTGGSIVFSALSSGQNHVIIRKRSGFGKNGYVYGHLDIYVPPAWWEHTWFYIILVVLLGLLFWLAIWFRTRYWRHRSQRFEEGVQNRTSELNDMILELEHSEEKLSEQLHFQRMLNENITHDVNAPLKYLTIYTGEILEHVRNNKLPDINEVEHIHSSANSIYALVDNLTQFLKSKYKQPTLSSINIWQLVQQKLNMFSIGAERKNILLINDTDPDLFINHNETLLGILLHNLIDNALKYTAKGSVTITTHQEKEGTVSLQITDTGKGMREEQVQQCNALFSGTTHRPAEPSGFGFIIVKEIAKLLRTSVHMESVVNKGTIITVTIPDNAALLLA